MLIKWPPPPRPQLYKRFALYRVLLLLVNLVRVDVTHTLHGWFTSWDYHSVSEATLKHTSKCTTKDYDINQNKTKRNTYAMRIIESDKWFPLRQASNLLTITLISPGMRPANYIVTTSLIGRVHTLTDTCNHVYANGTHLVLDSWFLCSLYLASLEFTIPMKCIQKDPTLAMKVIATMDSAALNISISLACVHYERDLIITMHADALRNNDVKPSVGKMLVKKLTKYSSNFLWFSQFHVYLIYLNMFVAYFNVTSMVNGVLYEFILELTHISPYKYTPFVLRHHVNWWDDMQLTRHQRWVCLFTRVWS